MQIRQRVHEGDLCYMHTPVVLQSYLISWNYRDAEQRRACEMLDFKWHIKENFSPRELFAHIIDDKGGSSVDYLKSILEPGCKIAFTTADMISASFIKRFGPVLVFQFMVYEDFQLAERLSYLEEQSGKEIGLHAMLLVGVRTVGAQKVFLLHNWWRRKQLIEVSERYLNACDGHVAFPHQIGCVPSQLILN
jgi:hypothetical protein